MNPHLPGFRVLSRRWALAAIGVLALLFPLIFVASPAMAAVTCSYNPTDLSVTITMNSELEVLTVGRSVGGTFVVSGDQGGPAASDCNTLGQPATVTNVARVTVNANPGGATEQIMVLDMSNGRFEPGISGPAEGGGTAEIEFAIDLGDEEGVVDVDILVLIGTTGDDLFRFGADGFNLNNDDDVDLTFVGASDDPSIEAFEVVGGAGNDTLTGEGDAVVGADTTLPATLIGGPGTDILRGGADADTLNGGADNDTITGAANATDIVTYVNAPSAVTVDLGAAAPQATGGDGADTIDTVERVVGSAHADTLEGDGLANRLGGGGGNDLLLYTAGADDYRGDAGIDTVDFTPFAGPVIVHFCTDPLNVVCPAPETTTAAPDTQLIRSTVENIIGTAAGDQIFGNSSANVLEGRAGNDIIRGGDGNDRIVPGPDNDNVAGDLGTPPLPNLGTADVIDFSAAAGPITVNLGLTTEQTTGEGNDTISEIENVLGSPAGDTITGNTSANNLNGGAGVDNIDGGTGNDILIGGPGNDTLTGGGGLNDLVDYSTAGSGVTVDLIAGTATSTTEGNDTLVVINSVTGSAFPDVLEGDNGNNTLTGGLANDFINGRGGNDTLGGGTENDTVSFEDSVAGVSANLMTGVATGDGNDQLSGFENITGSPFNDTITGDGNPNVLLGLAGVDMIDAGGGIDFLRGGLGNDTLNGGDGSDTVDYLTASGSVAVDLAAPAPQAIGADGNDTISNVENIQGSAFGDTLLGNAGANFINGHDGADAEDGRAGNDVFFQQNFSNGGDTITGGDGDDTVDYRLRSNPVFVTQDGIANDGETGEGDNVTEVEKILRAAVATQYLPEGATHSGFTTFILLANPDPTEEALASLTFLTPTGPLSPTSVQGLSIPPSGRLTVNVNQVLGSPLDVATKVESFGVPLSSEVAMHKSGSLASMNMSAASSTSGSWILPEGVTHSGFTTFVTIANPDEASDTHVDVDFLTPTGAQEGPRAVLVPAGGRTTLNVNTECECAEDVSTKLTVVASEPQVVAGLSVHKQSDDLAIGGSLGLLSTATTWVVPEGATHSGWATFVLVANPGDTAATVTATYLTGNQGTQADPEAITIPPGSRRTINVNARLAALGLQPDDVSTLIEASSGSVAVESTIQKQDSTGFVIGDSVGSGGANLTDATGTRWVAPEGATHSGFSTFILIANPTGGAAQVELTFLTADGNEITGPTLNIAAGKRSTVLVNNFVPNKDVSTLVEATSGRVVVEMAIDRVVPGQGFSKSRSLASRLS